MNWPVVWPYIKLFGPQKIDALEYLGSKKSAMETRPAPKPAGKQPQALVQSTPSQYVVESSVACPDMRFSATTDITLPSGKQT